MLKWFRKYNKYILVAGAALLMVAFLVPQALLSGGGPGQSRDEVLARTDIGPITRNDLLRAEMEIDFLRALSTPSQLYGPQSLLMQLVQATGVNLTSDTMAYVLMLQDAERMGIEASHFEARQIISSLNQGPEDLAKLAQARKVEEDAIVQAVTNWVTLVTYAEAASASFRNRPPFNVTEPMLRRMVYDLSTQVRIAALQITPELAMKLEPKAYGSIEPTAEDIDALFAQAKDKTPDEGKYGVGYLKPDRVKVEYITIPYATLEQAVTVEPTEALKQFRKDKEQYQRQNASIKNEDELYEKVKDQVIADLRQSKAEKLGNEVIGYIEQLLRDDRNQLRDATGDDRGYKVVPDSFEPTSFDTVLTKVLEKYPALKVADVKPDDKKADEEKADAEADEEADDKPRPLSVTKATDKWLSPQNASELKGIGDAYMVAAGRSIGFGDLVTAVKELKPEGTLSVLAGRLQAGLIGKPLEDTTGSRYIFRITAAEPQQVPSKDEVIDELRKDARRLAIYKQLAADKDKWLDRARADIAKLQEDLGTQFILPDPFPRRIPRPRPIIMGGSFVGFYYEPAAPSINEEINADKTFVDWLFDAVEAKLKDAGDEIDKVRRAMFARPRDKQMSLWIVRLQDYEPLTEVRYRQHRMMTDPRFRQQMLTGMFPHMRSAETFSMEALKTRLNYVEENVDDSDDEGEGATDDGV